MAYGPGTANMQSKEAVLCDRVRNALQRIKCTRNSLDDKLDERAIGLGFIDGHLAHIDLQLIEIGDALAEFCGSGGE